jgi:hypothetical protein
MSLIDTLLNLRQAFRLPDYVCHHTDQQAVLYSHIGPPWYHPPLSSRSGPNPPGGNCHSSHVGGEIGENSCALPFAFLSTDRSGTDRLFRRWVASLVGRRSERYTRGLKIRLRTRLGKFLRDYADENSYLIFGPDIPGTKPYNPHFYRCHVHRDNQGTSFHGVRDFVLCTDIGPPPGNHCHNVSLILFAPNGSP